MTWLLLWTNDYLYDFKIQVTQLLLMTKAVFPYFRFPFFASQPISSPLSAPSPQNQWRKKEEKPKTNK